MKFKIRKDQLDILRNKFDKDDYMEIELEPVIETATQAIYENQIRNEAYEKGLEYGYREGRKEVLTKEIVGTAK